MVSHVDHFDFIVVNSDKEAFILEMNLIQTHYPRYNIMLMDDSHYPYIALKKHNDPLLKISRSAKDDRYFYFGPFPNSSSCYQTIDLLNKIYPTRKCRNIPNKPCLYYSMGQCLAPCVHPVDPKITDELYASIKRFLGGDTSSVKAELKQKMNEASERLDFENAQEYKKILDSLEYTTAKQTVEVVTDTISRDVISFAERDGYLGLAILTYRQGRLLGKNCHVLSVFGQREEQIVDLVLQYYQNHELPKEIVARVDGLKEGVESVYEGCKVFVPKEGRLLEMVHLAELNARQALDAHFMTARLEDDNLELLENLGKILSIPAPYRIELFDNSHLQGSNAVGAMVCFINGESAKGMYRKFHLSDENAGDDYHSMVEVVTRRYSRLKNEGSSLPDLILVDGGLLQVHAAEEGLNQAGTPDIPLFGLFKNDKHQTSGLIDKNGNVFQIDSKSPLFFLLMRMQDEVHRYAITFHKSVRSKKANESIFDGISGIGMKRKEILEKHYPSREALLNASVEELSQILPEKTAQMLYTRLHNLSEKV